jgi:hypothetical protein
MKKVFGFWSSAFVSFSVASVTGAKIKSPSPKTKGPRPKEGNKWTALSKTFVTVFGAF